MGGPGKSYRNGITILELMRMFPDEATAYKWFVNQRWPDGPYCPHCKSLNVQSGIKHKSMTHRCRDCEDKKMFSLKTGTVMHGSKLPYRIWAIAIYLLTTNLKSIASLKLSRDLGITQKTAWHLAMRIRKTYEAQPELFSGPVEVDETYVGGKRKNMPKSKRVQLDGRGPVGKAVVVGAKDRETNQVSAQVVGGTDRDTLQGFIGARVEAGAIVYTDDHKGYIGLTFAHVAVNHSRGQYVQGEAHTNGIESFWSMLKRAYMGTFHHLSHKHLQRYASEFCGRHNLREYDTLDQMVALVKGMGGKRLRYCDLVG